MTASFRAFMSGLIDYAGLFPPATLYLDTSIRNYARYLGGRDAWMLGRFIAPATRLAELDRYVDELFAPAGIPLRISVLAGMGPDEECALAAARSDAEEIASFAGRHGKTVAVEALETKIPAGLATGDDPAGIARFLGNLARLVAPAAIGEAWFELPIPEAARRSEKGIGLAIGRVFASIQKWRESEPDRRGGLKIRCGGLEPTAFPDPVVLGSTLSLANSFDVPLKMTAGLHHPVRRRDAGIGVVSHGFFNVFGAAVLVRGADPGDEGLLGCILDQDPKYFSFDDGAFSWREHRVSAEEVARARAEFATSFGSCSFDEPREDLAALGLMEPTED